MSLRISRYSLICTLPLLLLTVTSACRQTPDPPPPAATGNGEAAASTAMPADLTAQTAVTDAPLPTAMLQPTVTPPPTPAPTPTIAPLPELSFSSLADVQIPVQGESFTAENGVVVRVETGALSEGVEATLSQWEIDPNWRQALEQQYTVDAPFVSLVASGVNDGQGRAILRLPAPSPDSRLVAVIDNTYLAMLDVPAQDGYLETAVRLGPGGAAAAEQIGSLTPGGSLHFTVLSPRTAAAARSRLAKPAAQTGLSCGIDMDTNFGRITHCRQSPDQTVQVNFLWGIGLDDAQGDQLAAAVAAAMARYGQLGFTAAKLTPRAPMEVVVETRSGDPRYRSMNGVIYLPVEDALNMIAGVSRDTVHELAHWIQDEEYNMAWAYWSGGKTWWLETAAENMVMLFEPAYISQNLITFGTITNGENRLALQQSPYQWPGDYYAHAQLVKLNMCADAAACPLSEKSFIEAINQGIYPYDSSDAQSKVSANLDAYAQYLLGIAPTRGNSAMPLGEPVSNGVQFGEHIQIAQTNKSDFSLTLNGSPPQMQKGDNALDETVTVAAVLQKDGVYPLAVLSGMNGANPGLPVALTIQPGAPFWYRLGNAPPTFNDGSKELVLQPINLSMGEPGVRLVAVGRSGGETFNATLSQVDLKGAWLLIPGQQTGGNISCLNDDGAEEGDIDKSGLVYFPSMATALGDFQPDQAGSSLTWEWNRDRLPAELAPYAGSRLQFQGATLIAVDQIQTQGGFQWVRTASQAPSQPPRTTLFLGIFAVAPAFLGWRLRGKRPYLGLLGLSLGLFFLAGCYGIGFDFWGSVNFNARFTKMEYLGGEGVPVLAGEGIPDAIPLWELSGTADYDVDLYVQVTGEVEGEDGADPVQVTSTTHCSGIVTYEVEARIYKDLVYASD